MKFGVSLAQLKTGQKGHVAALHISEPMRQRLLNLGMIPGTEVLCLGVAPSGSPIRYEIRGTLIVKI